MANPLFDLTGRTALITGSSRGIGFAIAEGLVEAGAGVVLNSRNTEGLEAARKRLADRGANAHAVPFDVTDAEAAAAAVDRIEREIGAIDILVNNAGIQRRRPLSEVDVQTWREVMSGDLDSVFFVGQAVARRMLPRGRGKIVNICSLTSEVGRPTIAPYTAAKGAVKMLTKAMCAEWGPKGLQVNGIGPGYFKTELNRALVEDAKFDAWVKARTPAGRWGELDELKGAAVFLASDAANFVNGHILYVDGGLLAVM